MFKTHRSISIVVSYLRRKGNNSHPHMILRIFLSRSIVSKSLIGILKLLNNTNRWKHRIKSRKLGNIATQLNTFIFMFLWNTSTVRAGSDLIYTTLQRAKKSYETFQPAFICSKLTMVWNMFKDNNKGIRTRRTQKFVKYLRWSFLRK